ncbi:hypothetical protein PPSIR1_33943 [Plesiocystis pacifica SIR-1]|uniref:UPF0102 protein PPSIR1_33943 n=1 Tax=Plesiocystis pacifica SIR-1 TaxID=391625 RepID=A6GIE5_9BACT|nr:YraN family protein [Plesiocystis pacifica]EDM74356.1 hypothetical protein PPSIR1_33943 [Plesiocystis pacifica SIR-1]
MASDEPSTHTRGRGLAAEQLAARQLERAGLTILARNVELSGAEVDLVASERDREGTPTIVFVEVRSRADDRRGHPAQTVDARKQARVRRAATAYLVREDLWERVAVRFDVIAIVGERATWLRDAF